jgi:hypothetical protein
MSVTTDSAPSYIHAGPPELRVGRWAKGRGGARALQWRGLEEFFAAGSGLGPGPPGAVRRPHRFPQ